MTTNEIEETVITVRKAINLLPKSPTGRRMNLPTLYRWFFKGLRTKAGTLVKLESVKVRDQTCTSREALKRFFQRLNCG